MKANSLSISLPYAGCNKNCPYCVSKMTGIPDNKENDYHFFLKNIEKAKTIADHADVSSVLLTGKGEPLLCQEAIHDVCKVFKNYPIEIQTNGILLEESIGFISQNYIDTIAVSIDSMEQLVSLKSCFEEYSKLNINIRITVNLVNKITKNYYIREFIKFCEEAHVSQLSFRCITAPDFAVNTEEGIKARKWIRENVDPYLESSFLLAFNNIISAEGIFIRELSFGSKIYMINGISCVSFEKCIQENSKESDIRSLIYWEDGHLSTSWLGSNYGRIF